MTVSAQVITAADYASIVPGPELATAWGIGDAHFAMFACTNSRVALITLLVWCLSAEEIDDQVRHAQRTGSLVLLVGYDTEQLAEVAADVAVKLPQHRRVSCEQAMLVAWVCRIKWESAIERKRQR